MENVNITSNMTIAEVQDRWPQTIPAFREYAVACVGCDLAAFCTIAEAAQEYQIEVERLLTELQACITSHQEK